MLARITLILVMLVGITSVHAQQATQPSEDVKEIIQGSNNELNKINDLMKGQKKTEGKVIQVRESQQDETVEIRVIDTNADGTTTKQKEAPAIEQRKYFSPSMPLPDKTKRAVQQSERWKKADATVIMSGGGKVTYMYGQTMPEIVTAPLHVTDIEMEEGETIQSIDIGDNQRWKVRITVTGSEELGNRRTHVIVSPYDSGLQTSLMIATNRRAYHLLLSSTKEEWMPYVGFQYPQQEMKLQLELAKAQMEQKKQEEKETKKKTTTPTGQNILDLNFDYKIEGDAAWKPLRVYSDAGRMYIQMPETIRAKKAPIVTTLGNTDFFDEVFNGKPKELVNYRVRGTSYIVDGLHDELVLFVGVGSHQEKVKITKIGK